MSATFAKGATVRQVVAAPIAGTVSAFLVDQETGELQYLVEWTDAQGNAQSRYFKGVEIEATA